MPIWLQHLLVFALVATCVAMVGRQLIQTFRPGKGAKLGSCCAKGCETQTTLASPATKAERIVFIPSSSLTRRD
ncbi:MAG: hypothetical protein WBD40_22755 [Tepidisphaeraceae bacterium]